MKNISKSLIALFAILAFSCNSDDVEVRPTIVGIDAPILLAPEEGNSYTLALETAGNMIERFVWTEANFGQDVAINYEVQLDKVGNEFANPQSLGAVISGTQLSVSQETLNGAVLDAGGEAFVESAYEVRVKASVNDTFEPMYSNITLISVVPYVAIDPVLFLVGNPQGYYGLSEWSPTTALEMRYTGDGTTKLFEAYVKVAIGNGFKFVSAQADWGTLEGNFGTIGGAQDGNIENSGGSGDIRIAEIDGSGLYYIQADMDNLTYKAVKMNWGIIGNATPGGWDGETAMVYDFGLNQFSIATALVDGELKFRARNASQFIYGEEENWKFNIGNTTPPVTYDGNSGNFPITAGSYTIGLTVNFDGTAVVTGL
jgi:hypothetical protein